VITAICNQLAIAIENSILMKEYEQNAKVQEYLSRFLPPHVVKKLKNPSELLKREGCIMKGTVIFVDIRGFTNMSEKSTPEDVVFLLNDYFQRVYFF
jgi:adenylate cyclase